MGFLRFLKKKREEMPLDESLDIPPIPPSIGEEMPASLIEEEGLPKEEFPPFRFMQEKPMSAEERPGLAEEPELEIPEFPPIGEKPRFVPKPPVKKPLKEVSLPKEKVKPEFHKKIEEGVKERKPRSEHKGPLYIKLEKFKETLGNISIIKSDLKKSDEVLLNLIKSREEKDKEFEKWHVIMEDMQKKLIFIEKTLFKGD